MQVLRRPTASVHGMPTSDVEGAMQALGLYNPEKIQVTGDAARGQTAAACYACHKIGDTGVDFGPNLTSYGQQQAAEIIIAAMATPSAAISHGYEGSTIKTTDGPTTQTTLIIPPQPTNPFDNHGKTLGRSLTWNLRLVRIRVHSPFAHARLFHPTPATHSAHTARGDTGGFYPDALRTRRPGGKFAGPNAPRFSRRRRARRHGRTKTSAFH